MPNVIETLVLLANCQKRIRDGKDGAVAAAFVADCLGVSVARVMELIRQHAAEIEIINSGG